ncbi:MAG TPA: FHA domain-containing protein [Candidatus Baltobacteraceae bacterium]|jgi:pSer/pThr/pTyr-binding forkhead associated (FHA) protein|nr:FHA domain-containing protein [Candidatus Baltobacteraceae bacterium]
MYTLEVVSGPHDGKRWIFEHEITIGRDENVALACLTLDRYVSRKHAEVREEQGSLVLVDLSSRNGTKIDGQSVEPRILLSPGQIFLVGRTKLRVSPGTPSQPALGSRT